MVYSCIMNLSKAKLKQLRYTFQYISVVPLLFFLKYLPLCLKGFVGTILGRFAIYPMLKYVHKKKYAIVSQNLEIILRKKLSKKKKDTLVKDYCSNIAKTFIEGLGQRQMTKGWLEKNVETSKINILLDAHKRGEKVIFVSAHIGSWEVAHKYLYEVHNVKTTIVYRQQSNKRLDHAYVKERSHVDLIEKRDPAALKRMIQCLKAEKIIVILLDQRHEGKKIKFFGMNAWFSTSVSRLAIKHKAKVICGYCVRTPNNAKPFMFAFEDALSINENSTPKSVTQEIFNKFEQWIRHSPTQWLLLVQDKWRGKHHFSQ